MDIYEKLDLVLRHLDKYDVGSYIWYRSVELQTNKNLKQNTISKIEDDSRLTSAFKNKGIEENEILPLLLHLNESKHIKMSYQKDEVGTHAEKIGDWPSQIKITLQGKLFIKTNGYVGFSAHEKRKSIISIIAIWGGIIVSLYHVIKLCDEYLKPLLSCQTN